MADTPISGLTAALALAGADTYPIVQGGVTKKATHTQLMTAVLSLLGDTDGTFAANSAAKFPAQSAVKTYVDGKVAGLSWKQTVRAASTANGTLASAFANGSTIDGVTLATGDRILLKDQSTGADNGIYTVNASGAPTRATDADSAAELVNASLYVAEGTANADKQFVCTTNAPITVGTTSLTFTQFSSGTTFTGGTLTSALNDAPPVTIASASTVNIGAAAANTVNISGTTTITAFDTIAAGARRVTIFAGVLTLTYNATSMQTIGGASIVTAAGDVAQWESLGSGNWKMLSYSRGTGAALTGLANFTESATTSSPNATVAVVALSGGGSTTNADVAIVPKGTGALMARIPDATSTSGNKGGASATDWQRVRSAATQVASGSQTTIGGGLNNTATNNYSTVAGGSGNNVSGQGAACAGGLTNTGSGNYSFVAGNTCTGSQTASVAIGESNNASGQGAVGLGSTNIVSGTYAFSAGRQNTNAGYAAVTLGQNADVNGMAGTLAFGIQGYSASGQAQSLQQLQLRENNTTTPTRLRSFPGTDATTNSLCLFTNSARGGKVTIIARCDTTNDAALWEANVLVKRAGTAASTAIVGTPTVTLLYGDTAPTSSWSVALTADTTLGALVVTVTGTAPNMIRWLCNFDSLSVVG